MCFSSRRDIKLPQQRTPRASQGIPTKVSLGTDDPEDIRRGNLGKRVFQSQFRDLLKIPIDSESEGGGGSLKITKVVDATTPVPSGSSKKGGGGGGGFSPKSKVDKTLAGKNFKKLRNKLF